MPPVTLSLPSSLLTFFSIVAVLWTIASIFTVFLALRSMLKFSARFVQREELAGMERRFESWLKDSDQRFHDYVEQASVAREKLLTTVQTLSGEVHEVVGELRAARKARAYGTGSD